ncbi:hypothetical protein Taro_018721 [Colocasia esculenta]|uniref:Uncharacterized protein n=1 Tax=Colocasia esculenta TaxID=4460 RepID=A0A843US37_COLES|nr:hypothetical protein [Colocasia esculenta]
MRTAAADQVGNDGLKGGIRGKLLGFRRDLRVLRPETLEVPDMDLQLCVCSALDINCRLASRRARAFLFPHLLPSFSPTCILVPLHYFRQSTGARGKAVMRAAAADQAGNDGLKGGIRGKLLGFWRDLRFFRSLFAFLRVTMLRNWVVQCGTVEVCVVFLDTLTPVFELFIRLRERRQ